MNIQVLAISLDQPFSQKAFSKELDLDFPVLSDRGGRVAKAYGVYNQERDTSERAYFLISKQGKIQWSHVMADPRDKLDIQTLLKTLGEVIKKGHP